MPRIAILTDSTANLTPGLVQKNNIHVIPLKILWKEEVLRDGVDITPDEFYTRLGKESASPTTSQATVAEFSQVFEKLAADYDAIFAPLDLFRRQRHGGFGRHRREGVHQMPARGLRYPPGSRGIGAGRPGRCPGGLCRRQPGDGLPRGSSSRATLMHTYFKVDTLKYLHRGGRIGGAARFLGTALGIKPILFINQGKIDASERVRTSKKALKRLIDIILEKAAGRPSHVVVMHASDLEEAEIARQTLTRELNCVEFEILDLSPAIGAHVGPGTLGIAIYPD